MVKKKHSAKRKHVKNPMILVLTLSVVVCSVLVLAWMLIGEVYLAEVKNVRESKESIVINTVGASPDLVNTLLAEREGCVDMPGNDGAKNIDYIVRELDGFALVHFGCALDAYTFYKKENDEWQRLNPTNQFVQGVPVCSHLIENAIPSDLQRACYDDEALNSGNMLLVPNLV